MAPARAALGPRGDPGGWPARGSPAGCGGGNDRHLEASLRPPESELGHWREKESVPPHPAPAAWVRAPGTRGHGWAAAAGSAGT